MEDLKIKAKINELSSLLNKFDKEQREDMSKIISLCAELIAEPVFMDEINKLKFALASASETMLKKLEGNSDTIR